MNVVHAAGALAAGLLVGTMPLWRYASHGAAAGVPHADHASWYGGALGMSGDHHVELVRRAGRVLVWVSDARRRPVEPRAVWATFDGADRKALAPERGRFTGADVPGAGTVDVEAVLADGTRVAVGFVRPTP